MLLLTIAPPQTTNLASQEVEISIYSRLTISQDHLLFEFPSEMNM